MSAAPMACHSIAVPTQVEESQAPDADDETSSGTGLTNLDHYRPFFRELDLDVLKLFSLDKVKIGSVEISEESVQDPSLRPTELLFLLKDLYSKVTHSLVESKTKKAFPGKTNELKNAGFSSLDRMDPQGVAEVTILNLDYLLTNAEEIGEYFKRAIDLNDGMIDGPVIFNEHTPVLTACFETIVHILKSVFSWTGFQARDQRTSLKRGLCRIGCRSKPSLKETSSLSDLIAASIEHLMLFEKSIVSIGCADALLKLLDAIFNIAPEVDAAGDDIKKSICQMSKSFLRMEWRSSHDGAVEKGAKFNLSVEAILNVYLTSVLESDDGDDALEALGEYSTELASILTRKGKDCKSNTIPTFTKLNLPMHYRVIFQHLNAFTKNLTYGAKKDPLELLGQWDSVIPVFFELVSFPKKTKTSPTRTVLSALLKQSRVFVDAFVKHAMPVMDKTFENHKERCCKLLKSMQQSTRYLQHVCQHSKTSADVVLANHVPPLRKSLETFLYRVKTMLAINDKVDTFWMGNLKNRNLDGQEIQTQAPDEASGDDESNDESKSTVSGNDNNDDDDEYDDDQNADNDDQSDVDESADDDAAPAAANEADVSMVF